MTWLQRIRQAVVPVLQAEGEMSHDQRRSLLQDAIKARFPSDHGMTHWIMDVFDDRVIVEDGAGGYWEIAYTLADGKAELAADMRAVKRDVTITYPAVQETARIVQAVEGADGWEWEVVIIKAGLSKTLDFFPVGTLAAAVPVFEGAKAFALTQGQHVTDSLDKPVKDLVGWYEKVRMAGEEMRATFKILKTAAWLRDMLMDSFARGKADLLGLSIDAGGSAYEKKMGAQSVRHWTAITQTKGIDVVWDPAAGGAFVRVLAAGQSLTKEDAMKEKLLKLLQARRPDLYKTIDPATITDDALEALVQQAMPTEPAPAPAPAAAPAASPAPTPAGAAPAAGAQAEASNQRVLQADSRMRLRDALAEAKLPDLVQARLKKRFDGQVVEDAVIQQAITEEREYAAQLAGDESGLVRGFGDTRIEVEGEGERIQMAVHKMLQVTGDDVKACDVPAFTSLRQAYVRITGDTEVRGYLPPERRRIQQAVTSATFAALMENTLHRKLIQVYREADYGERNIITVGSAADFKTRTAVRMGYFGDIATIDPELQDYQEIAPPTDEKVTYSVGQKGNLLTLTRRAILNDDLGGLRRVVPLLGRAARRTLARFIWNFAINNSTYDVDSTAWFHANHTNLGSTALSAAEIEVVITALANMTEPNSGEKLGLPGGANVGGMRLWLVVPRALFGTAKKENEREYLDSNFTPNPVRYAFGVNSERVIVLDLLTDATDWYVFRDAQDIESIVIDFLGGQEEPEFWLADQPTVGQMFVADKIQYKIRHEYGGDILDYRGAYKEVVAG